MESAVNANICLSPISTPESEIACSEQSNRKSENLHTGEYPSIEAFCSWIKLS